MVFVKESASNTVSGNNKEIHGLKMGENQPECVVVGGIKHCLVEDGRENNKQTNVWRKLDFKKNLTTLAQICVLMFTVLILYLSFTDDPFRFFLWHPILLSLGWTLLMTEAVLIISKDNILTRKLDLSHKLKIRYHWILQTIGAVLTGIGFLIITLNKNWSNKYHYTTWHGLLGLIGVVACVPACLNGIAALFSVDLNKYVRSKILKFIHVVSGSIAFIIGGISLILSVYTNWYGRNTNHNQILFYGGLFVVTFPLVWTIQRPLIKCCKIILKKCSIFKVVIFGSI